MTREDWTQAQYSVLGSVLIEPSLAPKVIQQTRPDDFFGSCKTVYMAIRKLFQEGTPVDVVSVSAALGGEYRQFLVDLMKITPTTANVDYYIRLCREQARIITVREVAKEISEADSEERIRKLLDQAGAMMVDKPTLRITTMSDALQSFIARHQGAVQYLTWPIVELNDRLYAEAGDFIVMGGRPSTGKSAWSLQCARHWAESMKVGLFSLETSSEKLFDRQMASVANVAMDNIKRNSLTSDHWDQIGAVSTRIAALTLEIIPAAGMSVADIRSITMMRGYQLIIIDYVQLINSGGSTRTEQVTNISLALHRMAQDMCVTVVALSQLKRKGDDTTPDSSDLRESGQLEQDADIIMMLKLKDQNEPNGPRELYITKNKEGTCAKTLLDFDGKYQRFSKAACTAAVAAKYAADGKRARRRNRANSTSEQMTLLPDNTPVPWSGGTQ